MVKAGEWPLYRDKEFNWMNETSLISRPLSYLFAANKLIYLPQLYLLFDGPRSLKFSYIESIKILFEATKRVCLVTRLNNTS